MPFLIEGGIVDPCQQLYVFTGYNRGAFDVNSLTHCSVDDIDQWIKITYARNEIQHILRPTIEHIPSHQLIEETLQRWTPTRRPQF